MKKIVLLFIAVFALAFTSCSNENEEPTQPTFEEYGEYFSNFVKEGEEYAIFKAIITEFDNEDLERDDPYEDEVWIKYWPAGSVFDLDDVLEKDVLEIQYGSGGILLTKGISGQVNNLLFTIHPDDKYAVYDWDEEEKESLTGYFKSPSDFQFNRITYYPDGTEYHQEARNK